MKRRAALKNMALAAGAIMVLPACEAGRKKLEVLSAEAYLSPKQDEILAEIVETILPATDTPGAKELEIHDFVKIMVKDCYEEDVRKNFVNGLDTVEKMSRSTYGRSFIKCKPSEKKEILQGLKDSDDERNQRFFDMVKGLTVRGYTSSEYFLTKVKLYEMMPGRYLGCVPANVNELS